VEPVALGLALSLLLQLGSLFQWCVRQSAEVVNQLVSVERVLAFSNLPSEAPLQLESDRNHKDWPQEGRLDLYDVSVRYRDTLPPSLSGVTLSIQSGHRVGVVGRTGSGKSTLVQALFRLLEAENGSIHLDGVDVSSVGLHCLRSKISVIPQVPVLFSGCTIRENLDPFGTYSDEALQKALEDSFMAQDADLDYMVAEGGSNFSVGQRQLLCLARAILRKNRVVVLDEPTANVDARTDKLLQRAIAESTDTATIIAVAHRLDTVIDYDRILVLGDGRVLEYASPAELLEKKSGHFTSMVNDTGETMAKELRRRAFDQRRIREERH